MENDPVDLKGYSSERLKNILNLDEKLEQIWDTALDWFADLSDTDCTKDKKCSEAWSCLWRLTSDREWEEKKYAQNPSMNISTSFKNHCHVEARQQAEFRSE